MDPGVTRKKNDASTLERCDCESKKAAAKVLGMKMMSSLFVDPHIPRQ